MAKKKLKIVGEPLIGFDLTNYDNYTHIKDIYHAAGRTSRSASEAFKDADYATPIWKCSSDFDRTMHFIKETSVGLFGVGFVLGTIILLGMWVSK